MATPIGVNWADVWEDVWGDVWDDGTAPVADPRVITFDWDADSTVQAFTWDASSTAQAFGWAAAATTQTFGWSEDMATDVRFDAVISGETISLVGTPDTATDITSYTLRFRLYDQQGGTLLLTPTVTKTTASTGVVTVALTAAQTTALRTSSGRDKVWFDFWRTDSGSEKALARGTLPILA